MMMMSAVWCVARSLNCADEEVLHTVRQHFGSMVRMMCSSRWACGFRLEVDVHVVCGQRTRIQNPVRW